MNKKSFLHICIFYVVLFLAIFTTVLILFLTQANLSKTYLVVIFVVLGLLVFALGARRFTKYVLLLLSLSQLRKQNEYYLGLNNEFYDLDFFFKNVNALKKKYKNPLHYLIAFTPSEVRIARNSDKNEFVTKLSGDISKMLTMMFILDKYPYGIKNYTFAFERGVFYIYGVVNDQDEILRLVEDIKKEIKSLTENNDYRLLVEPIFGICKTSNKTLINEDVDNVDIARNAAEKNFEVITFFDEKMRKSSTEKDVNEILEGLRNNEFVVYFQPKFDLNIKRFTSSEALIRWHSPKYGIVKPYKFIPIAEQAGLIHEIDTYVFRSVCEYLNETKRKGRRILPVSVNFSLYEFFSTTFLNVIINMLEEYKINPSLIQIEIIESTSQANQFLSISIIKKLQEKGIKILMDDFGVGFSNIGNFRKIPFNIIKIDKSFIDDLETSTQAVEIVKFLIQLCKVNNMEVVAEGVDNIHQVEILKRLKCDVIQGFYYSQALQKEEYDAFLLNNKFEAKEKKK